MSRLAGLVKFALRSHQGKASFSALATATAQRQGTVRAGIDWLVARGQLAVLSETEDEISLGEGDQQENPRLPEIAARLRDLLAETADVVAAVVPKDAAAFDVQQLYALCRARLEANFVPGFIQVLAQIPKTASEKPQDRFLIEAFEARPESVHRPAPAVR